jgi:hypothetical protein
MCTVGGQISQRCDCHNQTCGCVGHILKRHFPGATIQHSATVSVGRYFPRSNILPQDTKHAPRHGVCIVDVLHVSNQANDESYVAKGDP